ncbi:hypothetical protein PG990_014170 [Apiospora arundinis]
MVSGQGSNGQGGREQGSSKSGGKTCKICRCCEPIEWRTVPCNNKHIWCTTCLEEGMRGSSGHALICCGGNFEVTPALLELLDKTLVASYLQERRYKKTPPKAYCYCCEEPLWPDRIVDEVFASCLKCSEFTCTKCGLPWHEGTKCAPDPYLKETLDWWKCPGCGDYIEHPGVGCNKVS